MSTCPYCGTTYESTYPALALSARQQLIYDRVASAGPAGVQTKKLIQQIYGDDAPKAANGVLRVNIFEINRRIKSIGHKIKGRRDAGYVLIQDDGR